jgi:hypothetical protein
MSLTAQSSTGKAMMLLTPERDLRPFAFIRGLSAYDDERP